MILPDASGFRPIASTAFLPIVIIAIAGAIPPIAIESALKSPSNSNVIHLLAKWLVVSY